MVSTDRPIGPPPPFDRDLQEPLAALLAIRPPVLSVDTLDSRRGPTPTDITDADLTARGYRFEERSVPGLDGDPDISLLIARPGTDDVVGVIYYIHGGGMIAGTARGSGTNRALAIAQDHGYALVSVTYRLAPENPDPAPISDCYAGLRWVADNAAELGIDPAKIVIAGTSAGGGLAAGCTLMARDNNGPALAAQLLMCPMLDDRNDSASSRQMTGLGVWDSASNDFGWTALLGDRRGTDDVSPYAAPARATDLSGLPPTFLDVGSAETFRDEVVEYAARIWQAGGDAELHVWPGGFHGFDGFAPDAQISHDAREARAVWFRRVMNAG